MRRLMHPCSACTAAVGGMRRKHAGSKTFPPKKGFRLQPAALPPWPRCRPPKPLRNLTAIGPSCLRPIKHPCRPAADQLITKCLGTQRVGS